MADSTKRPRLRLTFVPVQRAAEDDPVSAAIDPRPSWTMTITENGNPSALGSFPLWHPHHLLAGDYEKVMAIRNEVADLPAAEYMARCRSQIQLMADELPAELVGRLTAKQMVAIVERCWAWPSESKEETKERKADTANPPDGERASDSASRSPLASTAGPTPS